MSTFRFPEWRELSRDEQIPIINLPTDKTYFVRGGPGTGKSILAIHRIAKLHDIEPETSVKMLVYNKALQLHLAEGLAASGLDKDIVQTCHKWLYDMGCKRIGSALWGYDWGKVKQHALDRMEKEGPIGHLILDEAQDIPKKLLEILHSVSVNATIFTDDKQAINEEGAKEGLCRLGDIRAVFEAPPGRTYDLTKNFRNTQPILDAAYLLRPLDHGELPDRAIRTEGQIPTIRQSSIEDLVQRVETYYINNIEHDDDGNIRGPTIGIGVPRNREPEIIQVLQESEVFRSCHQLYTNSNAREGYYKANLPGATVLPYDMMKGLEFSAVFMPILDDSSLHAEGNDDKKSTNQNLVYVVSTRARDVLEYSYACDMPASWLTAAIKSACTAGKINRA